MERLWNANYIKVWMANFMLFTSFNLIMPLLPLFLNDRFGADNHTIGVVLSGYTLTALFIRLFSGYIVDSYSRRKVLLLCYFFFALFFAGYFLCSSLVLFTIIRTLHGMPFGMTTVANSTMAVDVLPSSRRTEGIGYYGLGNNIAMAVAPSLGLGLYHFFGDFNILFGISLVIAMGGFLIDYTLSNGSLPKSSTDSISPNSSIDSITAKHGNQANQNPDSQPHGNSEPSRHRKISVGMDRFLLTDGVPEAITMACLSFSFGVISTYLAIYSRDVMHINAGTGAWFALIAIGLIASRIVGGRTLRKGMILQNATGGMSLSVIGYFLFVAVPNEFGYYASALIIGLGNGHMFPAMQNMFINLAPNNRRGTANATLLTAWDLGIGGGIILGGITSEHLGYTAAFWLAFIVNASGVVYFWTAVRRHFLANKLR